MRIVIIEMQDLARPGNATWTAFKPPAETPNNVWELMGHKVIEVDDKEGKALLRRVRSSLQLQLDLRALYHFGVPVENPGGLLPEQAADNIPGEISPEAVP